MKHRLKHDGCSRGAGLFTRGCSRRTTSGAAGVKWFLPWWRHQMKTFSALLALCTWNSPVTSEFPSQSQWHGTLMVSSICAWINGCVNNREAGDLRRHRAHCNDKNKFRLESHWSLFLWASLRTSEHWFRKWIGAENVSSHYLNQWWPSSLAKGKLQTSKCTYCDF